MSESWAQRAKNYQRALYFRELISIALSDEFLLGYQRGQWTSDQVREHLATRLEEMSVRALMSGERVIDG